MPRRTALFPKPASTQNKLGSQREPENNYRVVAVFTGRFFSDARRTTEVPDSMGWERRRQGSFYYRSERRGSRIYKTYFGNGPLAALAAQQDEIRQTERAREAEQRRQARAGIQLAGGLLDRLGEQVDCLLRMTNESEGENAQ
jgi:hypothetical protein